MSPTGLGRVKNVSAQHKYNDLLLQPPMSEQGNGKTARKTAAARTRSQAASLPLNRVSNLFVLSDLSDRLAGSPASQGSQEMSCAPNISPAPWVRAKWTAPSAAAGLLAGGQAGHVVVPRTLAHHDAQASSGPFAAQRCAVIDKRLCAAIAAANLTYSSLRTMVPTCSPRSAGSSRCGLSPLII